MFELLLHRRAAGYFERLDEKVKTQLKEKLTALARDPFSMAGVQPMQGEWQGHFRLRHGNLRIIYFIDRPANRLIVAHIGPRGDVYK